MARGGGERGGLPAGADALLALSPDRFTEERNALAAKLAAAGDARGAAEVRRLRRPVGLAWLLNRVARDRAGDVEALLTAGDRLRAGQRRALAGQGAAELRAAEEALRTAARALRGRAREVLEEEGRAASPGTLARLELLLRVTASAAGGARDALRTGTFSREPEVAAEGLSGLGLVLGQAAPEPERGVRAAPARTAASPRARGAGIGGAPAKSDDERRAERAVRERAAREERRRERAIDSAKERLEQAEKSARAARQAADAAERLAAAARSRAERAEATAAERRSALDALRRGE